MRLGIVVNVMDSDESGATTYRLAADAINMGHEVWIMSTGHGDQRIQSGGLR